VNKIGGECKRVKCYKYLDGKHEGSKSVGRPGRRRGNNIKMHLKKVELESETG
jgi:hypothetical protein